MKIEHLPINWVNGVKLTKDHFFGNYYNMTEVSHPFISAI